jgi:hypothetical protein
MAASATYTTAPDRSVHLFVEVFNTNTFCGMKRTKKWKTGHETVVGARACVTCYRNFKTAQRRVDQIDANLHGGN